MEIVRRRRQCEAIPASSAVAMAVFEQSGMRALIDSLVKHGSDRKLSPGMAVKAMIAPIHDARRKMPLSGLRHFFENAPADLLFGKDVSTESLNDNAFARNLDDIFDAGLDHIFAKCSAHAKRRFGFDSKIKHADATDYTIWAVPKEYYETNNAAVPAFGGNAKNKRNDLMQYKAATITDGDRILEYCKAYSGNAADCAMNADTLEFLKGCANPHENTVIADCKLVNDDLIAKMRGMNIGFISKLPSSFSRKVRDRIVASALSSKMTDSSVKGYMTYETEADTEECGKLRFIAYRSPKGTGRAMNYLEKQGLREAEGRFKVFAKKEFMCEADALNAFNDAMKEHKNSAYAVTADIVGTEVIIPKKGRGRYPKGYVPETEVRWSVNVSMSFDAERAKELAGSRCMSVIVTNLPAASADAGNIRYGATTDTVLRLYLDQYKVEHTYRLMKSGMGVDSVYVRTPSRANALLFVVAIATLVSSMMDAILRRNGKGRQKTVKQICTEIQSASVEYYRSENSISVFGSDRCEDRVFEFMDAIGLDPSHLLEIFDG